MSVVSAEAGEPARQAPTRIYWCVLTNMAMVMYVDDAEEEQRYTIPLMGENAKRCRMRSKPDVPNAFLFTHMTSANNNKQTILELTSETAEDCIGWQTDLEQAGVVWVNKPSATTENNSKPTSAATTASATTLTATPNRDSSHSYSSSATLTDDDLQLNNPRMIEQINTIHNMVLAYMPIMGSTVRDFVPKGITLLLIDGLINYLRTDFLSQLQERVAQERDGRGNRRDDSATDTTSMGLLQEPQAVIEHRQQTIRLYEATKQALQIIAETTLPDSPLSLVTPTLTKAIDVANS